MKRIIVISLFVAGLCSCTKSVEPVSGPVEISLAASIESVSSSTKAPFTLTAPTATNPIKAAIWASTTSHSYKGDQDKEPAYGENIIDYHNTTCFTSGAKQLLDHQLFYPTDHSYVYFVGLCPRSESGWQVSEATKGSGTYNLASHVFDGKEDVMYAQEVKNKDELATVPPVINFKHVLTWIKFKVVADNKDAIDTWGDVQKITISSKSKIDINLSTNNCSYSGDVNNAFPTYCFRKGESTDVIFENQNIELTTTPQEVAYTLCAAVDAKAGDNTNEYSLTVDTKYRPDTKVLINLKDISGADFSGNTGGCQFTVILRFKLGDNIVTTARATEWTNGGIGVTPIEE